MRSTAALQARAATDPAELRRLRVAPTYAVVEAA